MRKWTRREILKSGVAVPAGMAAGIPASVAEISTRIVDTNTRCDEARSPLALRLWL